MHCVKFLIVSNSPCSSSYRLITVLRALRWWSICLSWLSHFPYNAHPIIYKASLYAVYRPVGFTINSRPSDLTYLILFMHVFELRGLEIHLCMPRATVDARPVLVPSLRGSTKGLQRDQGTGGPDQRTEGTGTTIFFNILRGPRGPIDGAHSKCAPSILYTETDKLRLV